MADRSARDGEPSVLASALNAEPGSRERILMAAGALMERRGYHGTGMAEIVRMSGAPKGSVYFHFPGGKEQIAAEAVTRAGLEGAEKIRSGLSARRGLGEAIAAFIEGIALHVEASGFQAGSPLLIVAAETAGDNEVLNTACREAYELMRVAMVERLRLGGLKSAQAEALATSVLAMLEGGIVLSRVQHSRGPLRAIAKHACDLIHAYLPDSGSAARKAPR